MKRLWFTYKFTILALIPLLVLTLVACSENTTLSQDGLTSEQSLVLQSSLNYQRVKDILEGQDLSNYGIDIFLNRWKLHPYANVAKLFFEYGYDVNVTDGQENSLLMYACGLGGSEYLACDEFFDLFIAEGADIDHISLSGETAIDVAAENGSVEKVKALLALGAKVSEQTLFKALPECEPLENYGRLGIAKDILKQLDNTKESAGYPALYQAALLGNTERIVSLLPFADWNKLSKETFAACVASFCDESAVLATLSEVGSSEVYRKMLIAAAIYDNLDAVKLLLESYSFENSIMEGATIHALEAGAENSAEYLLKLGLVNRSDCEVLFSLLAQTGKIESMRCLAEQGLKPFDVETCLWQAANNNQTEFSIYLVEELGADPNGAICCAAFHGNMRLVRWLAEHGAAVDGPISPLNDAVYGGQLEIVQYLHEKLGADINGVTTYADGSGSCALENAIYRGYFETLKYLVENGADLSAQVRVYDPENPGAIKEISLFELAELQGCQTITNYLSQWI